MESSVGVGTAGNDIGVVYGRTVSKIAGGGGGNVGGREGRGGERAGGGGGSMSGNDGMSGRSVTKIAGG
jgi:hypothetical protein